MITEREKSILEILLKERRVTVKQLACALFISEPSVRRDLQHLEKQNLIKRIHGGALLEETALSQNKIPFFIREFEQSSAKIQIAQKAVNLIQDDNVIFLDASTSCYALIPFLASKKNLTVITNGVRALTKLAEYGIRTISSGGMLLGSCLALVGEEAHQTIGGFRADLAFFSCRGLSEDGYLTDISPEENHVRRHMLRQSNRTYLLCAEEKFNRTYYHVLCHRDELDGVLSESSSEPAP